MIGLLGRKKGMGAIFDETGRQTPVTVIEVGPCPVVQVKSDDKDGYSALQIGFDQIKQKHATIPVINHFKRAGLEPYRVLHEFRNFEGEHKIGEVLKVDLFQPGDYVEITGVSKGRGFAGVIKRHGFSRPNQSHGTHESFRGGGSIGAASYPARVWPGHKMPGRMGNRKVTVKNLHVVKVDTDNGLLLVKGSIPGARGGYLSIRKTR